MSRNLIFVSPAAHAAHGSDRCYKIVQTVCLIQTGEYGRLTTIPRHGTYHFLNEGEKHNLPVSTYWVITGPEEGEENELLIATAHRIDPHGTDPIIEIRFFEDHCVVEVVVDPAEALSTFVHASQMDDVREEAYSLDPNTEMMVGAVQYTVWPQKVEVIQ